MARLGEVLEFMDNPKAVRNLEAYRRRMEEKSGSLPKGHKYFLLNKLFDIVNLPRLVPLDSRDFRVV